MKEKWIKLLDIRNREIKDKINDPSWAVLHTVKYEASGWTEYFMTFEDKEDRTIFSLLRLRLPGTKTYSSVILGLDPGISSKEWQTNIKECKTKEEYEKIFHFLHKIWTDEFETDITVSSVNFYETKIFYIENNWEIVSAIQLRESLNNTDKWEYNITRIWTWEKYRNKWYWTILINKAFSYIKSKSKYKVYLRAEIKNIQFYKKFWFTEFWDFEDKWNTKCIVMKLDLEKNLLPELTQAALIREIHTFWDQLSIWEIWSTFGQHIGFWKKLILEAEKIAKENGYNKMAVIAWVWVREYYKKRWYELEWEYMTKKLI
jgi:histone acetyltransferase (RNA polymerase elongator complex component)